MEVDISGAKVFFTIPIDFPLFGKIQISETLVVSWIVMALITGLCIWLTRDLKVRNISKRQAVAEMIVETANKFVIGNMGEKFRYLIPFVSALFATSVVSNLISLIGLRSPTADLSIGCSCQKLLLFDKLFDKLHFRINCLFCSLFALVENNFVLFKQVASFCINRNDQRTELFYFIAP